MRQRVTLQLRHKYYERKREQARKERERERERGKKYEKIGVVGGESVAMTHFSSRLVTVLQCLNVNII